MKNTVATFREAKGRQKLSMLTAYDYTIAKIIDGAGINGILVGDSLGMVMLGYPDTLSVTMEDMINHCKAASRGVENALLVCDMPFMSYQISLSEAVRNAGRLIAEGGAQAVKLEGGGEYAKEISAIVRASVPVMGHLGLMPQSVQAMGGYKVQGKSRDAAKKLLDDAKAVEDAGAFALVLECIPAPLAQKITERVKIPVIGIGAGAGCDGQILVWQDMGGLNMGRLAKFVRRFANAGDILSGAFKEFDKAVKEGTFPASEHCYSMDEKELKDL